MGERPVIYHFGSINPIAAIRPGRRLAEEVRVSGNWIEL